jgi:hypothetical protein
MYTIVKPGKSGKFHCLGRIQDGTEEWDEDSLEGAVASMIQFGKVMNGMVITLEDISFCQWVSVQVVETSLHPWDEGEQEARRVRANQPNQEQLCPDPMQKPRQSSGRGLRAPRRRRPL